MQGAAGHEFAVFGGGGGGKEEQRQIAPVQRRHRQEVKGQQQQVQREHDAEHQGEELPERPARAHHQMHGVSPGQTRREGPRGHAQPDQQRSPQHKDQVGGRTGHRHPPGAFGITLGPGDVVRRAGPAQHPAPHQIGKDRHHHHAKGFPAHMRHGIQAHLPAIISGAVAQPVSGPRMGRLVADGGVEKNDVPDDAVGKVGDGHVSPCVTQGRRLCQRPAGRRDLKNPRRPRRLKRPAARGRDNKDRPKPPPKNHTVTRPPETLPAIGRSPVATARKAGAQHTDAPAPRRD